MITRNKLLGIAAILVILYAIHSWYYSPSKVSERQMQSYQDEINTLSWKIQNERADRARLEKEWKEKDSSLSWSINTDKNKMEILDNCIKAKAFPCEKADKKAISYLINSAYAEADSEPIAVPPTTSTGIINYRNDFTCEKRLKTTAIEYHFTAENYDSQDTNEKKLLSIWRAHTSPNGKVQGDGIGYHYVISKDGAIWSTRNRDCRAIADAWFEKELMSNENTEHIHISFIGDDKPTEAQTRSMISLGQTLINEYWLTRSNITSHAENAPKSLKEDIKWWYGSKENFTKNFTDAKDRKVLVLRNGSVNDAATYAWNTYKDMDFLLTIDAESSWNHEQVGDNGDAYGLCQINKRWHQDKIDKYKTFSVRGRVDYCRQLYVQWQKDGVLANQLHGWENRMTRSKYLEFK